VTFAIPEHTVIRSVAERSSERCAKISLDPPPSGTQSDG
jgi:hypothetical protein